MTKLNDKQDKAELDNAASRVRNLLKRGVCVQRMYSPTAEATQYSLYPRPLYNYLVHYFRVPLRK